MPDIPQSHREITLLGFVARLWQEKLFIILCLAIAAIGGVVDIAISPKLYEASVLVGHVTSVDQGGGSDSGGSSALGALLGVGGGAQRDPKFNMFLVLIRTSQFAEYLEKKYHYLETSRGPDRMRSMGDLESMLGNIDVSRNEVNNTALIALISPDSKFASQFLMTVLHEGDNAVRRMDTTRAQSFADYVEDRFKSEENKSVQDAMVSLLVSQERFLMVTQVDLPYAVQILDDPSYGDYPVSPRRRIIMLIALAVGVVVSLFTVLVWDAVAAERLQRGLVTLGPSQCIKWLFGFGRRKA